MKMKLSIVMVGIFLLAQGAMAEYPWEEISRFTITGGEAPQIIIYTTPTDNKDAVEKPYTIDIDGTRFSEYMMMALQNCRQNHYFRYLPDEDEFKKYQFASFRNIDIENTEIWFKNISNAHSYSLCYGIGSNNTGTVRLEIRLMKNHNSDPRIINSDDELEKYYIELSTGNIVAKTRFDYIVSTISGYKVPGNQITNSRFIVITKDVVDGNYINFETGSINFYSKHID